jgi:hypothetical protein
MASTAVIEGGQSDCPHGGACGQRGTGGACSRWWSCGRRLLAPVRCSWWMDPASRAGGAMPA